MRLLDCDQKIQILLDRLHPDSIFGRFLGSVHMPIFRSKDNRCYEFEVRYCEDFGNTPSSEHSARAFGFRLVDTNRLLSCFVRFLCAPFEK